MKLILEDGKNIVCSKLPETIVGSHWITDKTQKNLLNIISKDNVWILKSNNEYKITNSLSDNRLSNINYLDTINLENFKIYFLVNILTGERFNLYTIPTYENFENLLIDYSKNSDLIIGAGNKCDITINNDIVKKEQIQIEIDKNTNSIKIKNLDDTNKMYINNNYSKENYLSSGDIIFVGGIFIYFFGGLILVSNNGKLVYNSLKVSKRTITPYEIKDYSNNIDVDIKLYNSNQYYQRPPRFKRKIETKTFQIDAPTQKQNTEEMPLIYTMGPMMLMAVTSLVSGLNAITNVLNGKGTFKDNMMPIVTSLAMLGGMIVFPLLQKLYTKRMRFVKERKRKRKYKKYIEQKREEIFHEIGYQKQVLIEDNLPLQNVAGIILNKTRNLWERKTEHDDFLNLRLGIGTRKPDININYPEEHFTLEEDNLKDIIKELINESKDIVDVPITLNFRENNKVGIIGNVEITNRFIDGLMLQLMAYHGYDMLRMAVLTNNSNKHFWEKYINLPYIWNNEKTLRYFASSKDEINKVTTLLKEEYNYRDEIIKETKNSVNFSPYYIFFIDDINLIKNNALIKEILENKNNLGYTLIMNVDKVDKLPNECAMFVNVEQQQAGLFTNSMTADNQINFIPDFPNFSLRNCIMNVSNTPLDIADGKFVLPKKYSFLEMFDVGNVQQLDSSNRWKNNDIINTLETPVGIDEQGEIFKIDLHEKAHGPHGLVAGMTGSGKSEWIITYILSMAVNYSPEEVQFVLIDYKGGGLALTFDNRENNIKLPHVVGTITNLDIVEIKRSLASIESELKRRQTMFKNAREKLNESSMDIYKYQEKYRNGEVDEPMSHLFIISDEFAELKVQQPEFMDKLISTARIGRSLGVHLILATQKPSGVVDDQIWSNSKFRVCLKVQDKSDSNDMLKRPDAAMLKETGRFYLQVGYNEFFAKGQSAYAGSPYYESEKRITLVDSTIDFVDEMGNNYKKGNIKKNNTQYVYKGEELPNVLNYVINVAKNTRLNIKPLWLTRIPDVIYVDKLKEKYNYQKENYVLNPIIGEYDDPNKQKQDLLALPISNDGNVLIYGSGGSGKENLLTTMVYSLISNYTLKELNIYILDFGSEVLNNFIDAPHVADIIHIGNDEKINNFFKLIEKEINARKREFAKYNGNYMDYIKSGNSKPNMLVIINSYEIFNDSYEDYVDKLIDMLRDANKYGIYFVVTVSAVNGIRSKVSQNFKNVLTLQLNDETDYPVILGKTEGKVPSKAYGRGLIKIGSILEFQTAYVSKKETLYEDIKHYCKELALAIKLKATPVPILPEMVSFDDLKDGIKDISNLPIGLIKDTLEPAYISIGESSPYLITGRDYEYLLSFSDKLCYIISKINTNNFVFDCKFTFDNFAYPNILYKNRNFSEELNKINSFVEQVYETLKINDFNDKYIKGIKKVTLVIIGLEKFISSISSEEKNIFENILKKNKEINKIQFIFIDIVSNLKKCEIESFYKENVSNGSGLFIGDGFGDQYTIKPSKASQAYYNPIGSSYAYLVKNGVVNFVKIIEKI